MFLLSKIIIAVNVLIGFIDCQFENQYLGHHYTREEYNKLDLACDTSLCLRDAQLLLLAATQNKTIQPCDDFKEFSMGRFIELGALHERYESIGFEFDVQKLNWERYRKVLAAPIKETDIKPFKIAKNYYRKCINSDNVRKNGTAEVLKYVRSFGGAPFLDSSWDEGSFNIEELFEKEVDNAFLVFLSLGIERCPHPKNDSQGIICFKSIAAGVFSDVLINELIYVFKQLEIDEKVIKSVIQKYNTFLSIHVSKLVDYKSENKLPLFQNDISRINVNELFFTISQLNNYTNNTLNFLKILNSKLTIEFQLNDDSEIFIKNPEVILELLELMKETPKRILADMFTFQFLYRFKELFIVYAFDELEKQLYGTLKSYQRWEQCMLHLTQQLGPALQALHAETYFNKEVQDSVTEFTDEAVHHFIVEVNKLNIDNDTKEDVVAKVNTIKYIIGYPEEVLDLQKIEEFYEELELNGTEGLVETFMKMKSYSDKIRINPNSNQNKKIIEIIDKYYITYITDDNILYIPPRLIHYPSYHPNRSRFFNTATLFEGIVSALKEDIEDLFFLNLLKDIDTENISFINYVKWEESGGKELQLPGCFLTNRQMFWVARAHAAFAKHHPHANFDNNRFRPLFLKNFHINYKRILLFRETFNCLELTEDEEKEEDNFDKEYDELIEMGFQ